ncbi:MAG: hypothetical protein HGA20_03955 [Geobacteraceae bacterium]|nr:hypothetical protein [Geobacteraceae bacterium]
MTSFSASRLIFAVLFLLTVFSTTMVYAAELPATVTVEIADVGKSKELKELVTLLEAKGIKTVIPPANIRIVDEQTNCAVWIGKNVPLTALQTVLPEAIRLYPYLKFFYIVGERGEVPPEAFHRTIHIGGSIEAALYKKLNVIDRQEFLKTLAAAKSVEELHGYLLEKNRALKTAPTE